MFKPITTEKRPTYMKVVEVIGSKILSGELKPGERLPSERELAKLLNVSRASVREALKLLAARGLVKIVHGQGVFIIGENLCNLLNDIFDILKPDKKAIEDTMAVRRLLEVKACELAARRASQEQLKQIKELIETAKNQIQIAPSRDDVAITLIDHDTKFHLLIAESTGNAVLLSLMLKLLEFLSKVRLYTLQIEGRQTKSLKEHEKIAEAIINRDPEKARIYMEKHLQSVEEDVKKVIESLTKSSLDDSIVKNEFDS